MNWCADPQAASSGTGFGGGEQSVVLRARTLRDTPPFSTLPRNERAAIAASSEFHDHRHGDLVLATEHTDDTVVVVLDGIIQLIRSYPERGDVTVALVRAGHVANTEVLLGSVQRDIIAKAIGPARTIHTDTAKFLSLAGRCPAFYEAVARGFLVRREATYADTVTETTSELPFRLLDILCQLTRPAYRASEPPGTRPLVYRLSHEEIARLVGAHRSSVTRALTRLDGCGAIVRERGHVVGVRSCR